jgi:hypothetical protein
LLGLASAVYLELAQFQLIAGSHSLPVSMETPVKRFYPWKRSCLPLPSNGYMSKYLFFFTRNNHSNEINCSRLFGSEIGKMQLEFRI